MTEPYIQSERPREARLFASGFIRAGCMFDEPSDSDERKLHEELAGYRGLAMDVCGIKADYIARIRRNFRRSEQ